MEKTGIKAPEVKGFKGKSIGRGDSMSANPNTSYLANVAQAEGLKAWGDKLVLAHDGSLLANVGEKEGLKAYGGAVELVPEHAKSEAVKLYDNIIAGEIAFEKAKGDKIRA